MLNKPRLKSYYMGEYPTSKKMIKINMADLAKNELKIAIMRVMHDFTPSNGHKITSKDRIMTLTELIGKEVKY